MYIHMCLWLWSCVCVCRWPYKGCDKEKWRHIYGFTFCFFTNVVLVPYSPIILFYNMLITIQWLLLISSACIVSVNVCLPQKRHSSGVFPILNFPYPNHSPVNGRLCFHTLWIPSMQILCYTGIRKKDKKNDLTYQEVFDKWYTYF